ncbi:hypothetical protein [Sporosarcina sp. PTS2304]|nr:hypothetical protein [Sporosarcina sp. PTS2304]
MKVTILGGGSEAGTNRLFARAKVICCQSSFDTQTVVKEGGC